MTDHDTADIAWMKALAAEGAQSPVRGGSILFVAGLIYGTASLAHWTVAARLLPVDPAAFAVIWGAALILFFLALIVLIAGLKRRGGVETAANRAFGIVWSGLGWGIFALFASIFAVGWAQGDAVDMAALSLLIPSFIMAFYGVGWAVTATMLRSRALWGLALGAFAAAPLLGLMAGTVHQYLAYTAALFFLMALPGYILMRRARA